MSRLTHAAYKKLDRTVSVVVIGANLLGALITLFYLAVVQPIPQGSSPVIVIPLLSILVSLLAIAFLLFLGYAVGGRSQRHFPKWVALLVDGAPISDVPIEARREVLKYSAAVALVSLAMWSVAAFFFRLLVNWCLAGSGGRFWRGGRCYAGDCLFCGGGGVASGGVAVFPGRACGRCGGVAKFGQVAFVAGVCTGGRVSSFAFVANGCQPR